MISTATASLTAGEFGGLTVAAAREALFAGRAALASAVAGDRRFCGTVPGPVFIGLPVRSDGTTYGFIEAYERGDMSFSMAAEIERAVADFANVLQAADKTKALESAAHGTILIADSDGTSRALLRQILSSAGFGVLEARSGAATIALAHRDEVDLILMDCSMPVADGYSTLTSLRADARAKTIPIVLLTGGNDMGYRVEALEVGAQDFITKPCEPADLVRRITQILRWRRLLSTPKPVAPDPERKLKRIPANLSRAMYESRQGNVAEALTLFVTEAQACDSAQRYADAARAYRGASVAALHLLKYDLSNKFIRLTGKMYLCLAENTNDASIVEHAYVEAAKCFLEAGNMPLVTKAIALAASFESLADDAGPTTLSEA